MNISSATNIICRHQTVRSHFSKCNIKPLLTKISSPNASSNMNVNSKKNAFLLFIGNNFKSSQDMKIP